ncbi:MAG: HD-GYP domain-containing protein [Gammaproteobacteria bacterium]|nr:HD-GYP domain-containing protein [Gammaproteobacteria bacterium]
MHVVELDRPWLETPFLFQGFTLENQADIKAVQQYCQYVYVEVLQHTSPPQSQARPAAAKKAQPAPKRGFFDFLKKSPPPPREPQVRVEEEMPKAVVVHERTSKLVKSMLDDIRFGALINTTALKEQVNECVESIIRNPDAMLWLTQLRNKDSHSGEHALNACILAVVFGRYLGLPKDELEKLGLCGLLHDVGKTQVPDHILRKPGALTADEMAEMKKHTIHGRNILMATSDMYYGAVDVAYTHHERMDGSGYPRGLTGSQISPYSRMLAVIDTYSDLISPQIYRKELTAFEALKIINKDKASKFDEQLVKHFVAMVGVFPVGSIVELSNGEVGIVIATNRKHLTQPRVLALLDSDKFPCKERIVDLAAQEGQEMELKIGRILRNGDYGIDVQALQRRGLQLKIA